MNDFFLELSLIVVLAAIVSMAMRAMRQPLIIGYILTGVIAGPLILDAVHSEEVIDGLAEFGIALLLFIIGLGLNPKVIKEVGLGAAITGVGQVTLTTIFSWLLVTLLGFDAKEAIYIGVAMSFSSTIIILKLLSDKKEQHRLYGKISIGVLLVQDILATLALIGATASSSGTLSISSILELLTRGLALAIAMYLVVRFILPYLRKFISNSQELLFVFSIAWGFGMASLFKEVGFSLEVGALAAGIALATQPFAIEVGSRLRPLRDFFIILFFVTLGTHINLDGIGEILPAAAVLSTFILITNPIIVMSIMGLFGYTKKTSFKTGIAMAQISEFSLVFILLGNSLGQISDKIVSLVTLVGIITITISSYMIIYSDKLYVLLGKYLGVFERSNTRAENEAHVQPDVLIIGYKRGGEQFIKVFKQMKKRYLVLDYDPAVIEKLDHDHVPSAYGDVTDAELLEELHVDKVKLVVSVMSDHPSNLFIAKYLSNSNPKAVLICSAETPEEASELYSIGASYVMMPHYIGNERIASFIKKSGLKRSAFDSFKGKHLVKLGSSDGSTDKSRKSRHRLGKVILGSVEGLKTNTKN